MRWSKNVLCPIPRIFFLVSFVLILFILSLHSIANAQQFTKVVTGPHVTDDANSEGVCWVDYDNDGFLDLFVTNTHPNLEENNFLYHNNGDGTFTKITNDIIVNDGGYSRGCTWGDFDNDGDIDAFIVNYPAQSTFDERFFYLNNGDGTFRKVTAGDAVNDLTGSSAAAWVDYDNDGDLDLYITTSWDPAQGAYGECSNSLYRNDNGELIRITGDNITADIGASYGVGWADCDNDGDQDIFVANSENQADLFYLNNGDGSFTKVISGTIVNLQKTSWGCSWGDYDNDGDLDLFVTTNSGNLLFQNNGNGTFLRITSGHLVTYETRSMGSCWGDYDNDGDLDLFVTNFSITSMVNNFLYNNNGDGVLSQVNEAGITNDFSGFFGAAWGDYDRDGDMDLFVANGKNSNQNNLLYQNNGNHNNWINIKCVGTNTNRSAIGVKVRLYADIYGNSVWQMREISGQTGFCGQNSLNAHFGLGDATIIDSIKIEWTSGLMEVLTDIKINRFMTVTEGEITGIDNQYAEDNVPQNFKLFQNYPNPFNAETIITYELGQNSSVSIEIYNLRGQKVQTVVEDKFYQPGYHSVKLDGDLLSSGVYCYRLKCGEYAVQIKKMVVLK